MSQQSYFTPWRVGVFGVALAIGIVLALTPFRPEQDFPALGTVADRDIVAMEETSFISASLTAEAQEVARSEVDTQFEFDPDIRPAQLEALRLYLEAVVLERRARNAPVAVDVESSGQSTEDSQGEAEAEPTVEATVIPGSKLPQRDETFLLAVSDPLFANIEREAPVVLESLLQERLYEEGLDEARLGLHERIDPGLSLTETTLIASLVSVYLRPTMIESAALTELAQDRAARSVAGVPRTVVEGELIVPRGTVVDDRAAEALAHLTPRSAGIEVESLGAIVIFGIGASVVFSLYLMVWRPVQAASDRRLILLAMLILFSVAAARAWFEFALPGGVDESLDLMLPLAAGPVLVAALLSTGLGITTGVLISLLAGLAAIVLPDYGVVPGGAQALRPLVFFLASSLGGVFAATRAQALAQYGLAGLAAGAAGFLAGAAIWLFDPQRASDQLGWLALAALVTAALVAVITIGAFSLLGALFGITTPMRLLELAQLQRPLLRRLQEEAPGTFHHSLLVATMSERAAAQIGADPLLVRVGAYYHDIGKLNRPTMFIENQEGTNPHDALEPSESARLIIQHVTAGEDLARRDRLPPRIRDFILEHHGSRRVAFFYRKAAMSDPRVDPRDYTYPGPPPQTRETAIVMLADSCEAVVRASGEHEADRIGLLVDGVFDERLRERQLDHCDLTLNELRQISASFKHTLIGVHHQRIEYPPAAESELRATPREVPRGESRANPAL
ncbi:MAG: HDIG domain-containing protein [Chloroflexota bacterium]|nr:HDIG domain-containing protein [Chloroflexota bacterium]